jgi:NADH:ubiquinone oxidoreductase subunit 2 (subunit N)
MASIAFGLQAIGLGADSAQVLFAIVLPQAFAAWGQAFGLSRLTNSQRESFQDWPSLFSERPLSVSLILLAFFSATGLPLLAGFVGRIALLDKAAASSPLAAIGTLLGGLGLALAGLRMVLALLPLKDTDRREWAEESQPAEEPKPAEELGNPYVWGFVAVGAIALLGFGLLPNVFLSAVPHLAAMFSQLAP